MERIHPQYSQDKEPSRSLVKVKVVKGGLPIRENKAVSKASSPEKERREIQNYWKSAIKENQLGKQARAAEARRNFEQRFEDSHAA